MENTNLNRKNEEHMVSSAKQIKKFLQGAFTIVIVLFEKKQSSGDSLCGFHFQVTAEPSSRTLPSLSTSSSCRISAFFFQLPLPYQRRIPGGCTVIVYETTSATSSDRPFSTLFSISVLYVSSCI